MKTKYILRISIALVLIGSALFFSFRNPKKSYSFRIPVNFVPFSGHPRVDVNIEGQTYSLIIDTGICYPLTLDKKILEVIHEKESGETRTHGDFKDNIYISSTYKIPTVRIACLKFENVPVAEQDPAFVTNTILYGNPDRDMEEMHKNHLGTVGVGLLHAFNFCFDFHNSCIYPCSHIKELKKYGYPIDEFVRVPFDVYHGIVINIDTDLGTKRFLVDTGTTHSLIRPSLLDGQQFEEGPAGSGIKIYKSSKFVIGNKDFGSKRLAHFEITPFLEKIDGVLGMDFLRHHTVFIDFENNSIYFNEAFDMGENAVS